MKLQRALAATGALSALLLTATVLAAPSVSASTIFSTSGDFTYNVSDGVHASIDGYTGLATDVVVPGIVDGFPVTAIGVRAFQDRTLTSVTLPAGIVLIDALAFNRTHLTSVILPSSLTTIGTEAFSENNLTSVIIPASVTTIDTYAFYAQPTLHSARFLGDAPAMNATVFSGVAADFIVSYPSGRTGYGSGDTWLGFPVVTFVADGDAPAADAELASTGLETTPAIAVGMLALLLGGAFVALKRVRRNRG
jgi:LPXTG-motif cell wall-anchored protein